MDVYPHIVCGTMHLCKKKRQMKGLNGMTISCQKLLNCTKTSTIHKSVAVLLDRVVTLHSESCQ